MPNRQKSPRIGRDAGAFAAARATAGQLAAASLIAAAVAAVSLAAIARVEWPAYPSSNQLHALTTVGQVGCLLGLVAAAWLWRTARRPGTGARVRRAVAWTAAVTLTSAFAVVTLGMPLGATRLYLFGVSVDQQFRTEYLTRLTQSAALRDMTYLGLPPYYPPGWFWLGGRLAALTGTPATEAWTVYKPWAIASMAIAAACALTLWNRMVRFEYALMVTTATTAVTLAYSSPEPYAAMITVLLPPVLVLAWSGLHAGPDRPGGGWAAAAGVGVFLGFAATFYTLLFVFSAFTVTLMALLAAALRRRRGRVRDAAGPLGRLAVIAAIAAGIGAITWLPFLLRAAREPREAVGSAQHYLPGDGAELSFPMFQFTLLGALCLLGTVWLVVRGVGSVPPSVRASALGIGVLAVYAWSLLSMLATLARTTLLSFRLQPTLLVLLAAAGAFGFAEVAVALIRRARDRDEPGLATGALAAATALGLAGAVAFSQQIPEILRPDITVAYTDTDGFGARADRRPAGSEQYYARIDAAILAATGVPRDQTVVLTADYSFLAYYPYWGFQGLTSHYANPLARFKQRATAIEAWSELDDPAEFARALDALPWPAPTVFLMRHGGGSGAHGAYTLRLAKDVYPNHPNVRRYHVELDPAIFDGPQFTVTEIGPFVLAVRAPRSPSMPS